MKSVAVSLTAGLFACVSSVSGQTVLFSDDFESGNLNLWTQGASALTIDNTHNVAPSGGTFSAYADLSADRMYHNLGTEVSGYAKFTVSIYDSTMTRAYSQMLAYTGAGYNDGTLQQLFAIGKYSSVSLPGEVYDATKYQARVVNGANSGWFNLNAAGAPSRSTGWHEFAIERMYDGTTVNFYVDGILSRTITGTTFATVDSVSLGFGTSSSSNGDAWYDGAVVVVPEPSAISLSILGGIGLAAWLIRRRVV